MVFQISSFLMGNSFYYFLLQLGARHWGGERVVRVRRQIREEEPDRLLSTSASTTTPIMSGSGGGLRRNLSRGELRTIIGLTLFASLSDMVFLSNSPQNHPLTSSSSILNASNSILGTSNLTLSNSGWTMNDQNPNKTKSLDHTKPLNTLQEDFYDKTKSDDEKKFVGINDKNDGKEMNNPRKVNRDINMVKNNQNRLNKDSNTNLSSNNDYEILDSLPAFCVHMIVLVSCIFLTYLQLLQVRFFRKKLQEGKYIVLGFDWVPNEQGKQINSQRSKIRKYKRIEVYHWFNLFLLLIPAASIQVLSVLFLIRTDTRGRRVFSDKWGFTATFYTNQLCTTHAFVFWTICSLSGLL